MVADWGVCCVACGLLGSGSWESALMSRSRVDEFFTDPGLDKAQAGLGSISAPLGVLSCWRRGRGGAGPRISKVHALFSTVTADCAARTRQIACC
eukprot:1353959-Pleurochrysis_carterae.AAC.5